MNNQEFSAEGNQKLIKYFDGIHDEIIQFIPVSEKVLKIKPISDSENKKAALIEFEYPVSQSFSIYYVSIRKEIKGRVELSDDPQKLNELSFELYDFYSNADSLVLVGSEMNKDGKGYTDYDIYVKLSDIIYFHLA